MIEHSLAAAREILSRAQSVASFSGAGLSAESGIPTFRHAETDALWSRFDPMELASVDGFAANPKRVIDWYNMRRSKLAKAAPNPAHEALARQSKLVHITQNVDDLLERAGASAGRILHLHGMIGKDRCSASCGREEAVELSRPRPLRVCPNCGEWMRPAVVWFGESLPAQVWHRAETLCSQVDCLLVIGTSASVYPAAGLLARARDARKEVIVVNTQPLLAGDSAALELIAPAAKTLPQLLDGLTLRTL